MSKYSLMNDYSEGCHPEILHALTASILQQHLPYGDDEICARARGLIRDQWNADDAEIYFVTGGTLANSIIAASTLRAHEAVIAADSGHIATYETGAIEATGHKVVTVPAVNGKLTPTAIQNVLSENSNFPHVVPSACGLCFEYNGNGNGLFAARIKGAVGILQSE